MAPIRRDLLLSAALAAVFCLSFLYLARQARQTPFHGDESGWISSYYYADLDRPPRFRLAEVALPGLSRARILLRLRDLHPPLSDTG